MPFGSWLNGISLDPQWVSQYINSIATQQQNVYGQQQVNAGQWQQASNQQYQNHVAHMAGMGMNFSQGEITNMGLHQSAFQSNYQMNPILPKTIDECCDMIRSYINERKALKCLLKV